MAGFGTILEKPIHDAFRDRIVNTHPALLPGVQGLARGRGRARRRGEGHRLHGPLRHASRSTTARSSPRRRCRSSRRHRRDAARADQGSRAPALPRGAARSSSTSRRTRTDARALLSVYDKTGLVEFARGLARARLRAGVVGRHRPGDRRGRAPGHRRRRRHRRRPRCSTTGSSRCTRRSTAASSPTAAKESHRADLEPARHRAVRPRRVRTSTRSSSDPTSRPSTSAARRWCAPRRRTTRGSAIVTEPRRSTTPCSPSCAHDGALVRRRPAARSRSRRSRSTAAYDAAIVRVAPGATTRCRSTSSSRSSAPTSSCATARTRTSRRRATACAAPRAGGTASQQHSGLALCTSTSTTPTPRGASCTTSATGRPCAIIKHANPCGVAVADDLATAYQRALECDERSAFGGIVALNRPIDAATVERMVAGPQADVVIAPGYDAGHARRAAQEAQEHPPARGAGARGRRRSTSARSRGGFLVQDAAPLRGRRATTGGSSPSARPPTSEWRDAELAWRICGHVKSNAIVLVKDGQAVGIGAGQQNRVESGEIAAKKAAGRAAGGACASRRVLPVPRRRRGGGRRRRRGGGAARRRDAATRRSSRRADELGLAMVFTGERHFLH